MCAPQLPDITSCRLVPLRSFEVNSLLEKSQHAERALMIDSSDCDNSTTQVWNFSGHQKFLASHGSVMFQN
jgi:hypothetical protein